MLYCADVRDECLCDQEREAEKEALRQAVAELEAIQAANKRERNKAAEARLLAAMQREAEEKEARKRRWM